MKRIVVFYSAFACFSAAACAQNTITGTFPNLAGQQLSLVDLEGFDTYVIDSVKVSQKGIFHLSFSANDYGMGFLAAEDSKAFIVILDAWVDWFLMQGNR